MRVFIPCVALLLFVPLIGLFACSADSGAPKNGFENSGGGSGMSGAGGSGASNGAGGSLDLDGGPVPNPCESDGAPEQCKLVPSGPACGDGKINQDSEKCDDGNSLPGDGCSGVCVIEDYFECPTPGQLCVSTIVCGDGVVGPGEACDDGNKASGDGCSEACNLVEKGYICRTAGAPCTRVFLCGDGTLDPTEGCDDGDNDNGDGCDSKCRMELGFKCSGSPSVCTATTCGDSKVEGAESCDDGNKLPFDGCSATCQSEPKCASGPCTSSCGDGIVLGEDCDDGNLRNGDGCSSTCKVESGHKCNNNATCVLVDGKCTMKVPAVYRDFNQATAAQTPHPDFQPTYDSTGQKGLVQQKLVALNGERVGKPEYTGAANGNIQSVASFREWYRSGNRNATIPGSLVLWDNGNGGFVNRWGPNGEQWVSYTNLRWCANGNPGETCALCTLGANEVCLQPCTPWGNNQICVGTRQPYDGTPTFFPIDNAPGILTDARYTASIPPDYGGNWNNEPGGALHNFHFTSEIRYWFEHQSAAAARLDFLGDDDVWVFVNGTLALDLGGWHPPLADGFTLNAAAAQTFGLTNGKVYEIEVFQAERKTTGSSFKLTLSGFNVAPSDCTTDCGDGTIAPGEECDDGVAGNKGGYNECTPQCTFGPRCGDGIKQTQFGEVCDDRVNNGSYGGCAPSCQLGPHCGDGVVQPDHEKCDDGVNDGGYGECAPGCVLGPFCGDGKITVPFEQCDDGNNSDKDGCSAACKLEVAVPG